MGAPAGTKKGIPGIPVAALSGVKDENTRQVLQAIVDGLQVRNGNAGSGEQRFITAAELGEVRTVVAQQGQRFSLLEQEQQRSSVTGAQINRIINDLQAQVMESLLWKELGERITLIEGDVASITTTVTVLSNDVAAVVSDVTTLQVQMAGNTAAIQTEATVRANADNDIYAKYSVKIDVNGYVSGFGLLSTANNSTPFSDFIVRADRFSIGSPSGPDITPAIPFIVKTTPTNLPDGTSLPPGVYMSTALVKELFGAYIYAGLLEAASVYTGSRFIDKDSKFPVLSAAAASWYNSVIYTGTTINTSANLTMYGPNFHATVPLSQRVSIQPTGSPGVTFLVTATATINHFFSLYYSTNGGTTWIRIATTVEPQSGYGSVTISGVVHLSIAAGSTVDFGVSVLNASGTPWDGTHIWIQELSMSVLAINI